MALADMSGSAVANNGQESLPAGSPPHSSKEKLRFSVSGDARQAWLERINRATVKIVESRLEFELEKQDLHLSRLHDIERWESISLVGERWAGNCEMTCLWNKCGGR